jgi:hypothetical protein
MLCTTENEKTRLVYTRKEKARICVGQERIRPQILLLFLLSVISKSQASPLLLCTAATSPFPLCTNADFSFYIVYKFWLSLSYWAQIHILPFLLYTNTDFSFPTVHKFIFRPSFCAHMQTSPFPLYTYSYFALPAVHEYRLLLSHCAHIHISHFLLCTYADFSFPTVHKRRLLSCFIFTAVAVAASCDSQENSWTGEMPRISGVLLCRTVVTVQVPSSPPTRLAAARWKLE